MDNEKTYLSKEKFKELESELDNLKTVRRKEIAEKLEYAKSLGDLSENAEYQEARESQAGLEERIANINAILKVAVIVSGKKGDSVDIGSKVTIKKKGAHSTTTYEVVGSEETDVANMKISNNSPLGEAMIGKKKGDAFTFDTPSGEMSYTIVKIS